MSYVLISRTSDENSDQTRDDWIVDDPIDPDDEGFVAAADPGRVNGNDVSVAASTFTVFDENLDSEVVGLRSSLFSLDWLDQGSSGYSASTLAGETSLDKTVFSGPGLGNNPEFAEIGLSDGDLAFALDASDWGIVSNIEVFIDSEDLADMSSDGSGFRSLTIENFKDVRIKIGDGQAVDPSLLQSSYAVNVANAKSGQLDFSEANAGINLSLTLSSDGVAGQNSFVIDGSAFRDVMTINPGDLADVPEDGVTVVNDGSLTLITANLGAGRDYLDARNVAADLHIDGGDDSDTIIGGSGEDVLLGGAGFDFLVGGPGADVIDGGPGAFGFDFDFAAYHLADSGISVDLAAGAGTRGDAAGDVLIDIENVYGSFFDDEIAGDDGDNTLYGLDGDDILTGAGGVDGLVGGAGNDQLFGGAGNDSVYGDDGNDVLNGGDGIDSLYGGAGDDVLDGGGGFLDFLEGGAGADTLIANAGTINRLGYLSSTSGVNVNLETGAASGGDAEGDVFVGEFKDVFGTNFDDVLVGNSIGNWLQGYIGNNTLVGGGGNDTLQAGSGDDVLDGGDGNDQLAGGGGNDVMTGGAGADRFIFPGNDQPPFAALPGDGVITDFDVDGGDVLQFQETGYTSLADLIVAGVIADGADGVTIQYADESSVTLLGVSLAELSENDFVFTNFYG